MKIGRSSPVLAAAAASIALSATPVMAAPSGAADGCELHVWGAVPDYGPNGRFAAPGAPKGSSEADRSNPVANINALDPVQRLKGVDDAVFKTLLPDARRVEVVRHPAALDIVRARAAGQRLSPSSAECYADLVVTDLYDIYGTTKWQGASGILPALLTAALAAPDGMHATYLFRRFADAGKPVRTVKQSFVTPLAVGRPDWSKDVPATIAALDNSIAMGVAKFAGKENKSFGAVDANVR